MSFERINIINNQNNNNENSEMIGQEKSAKLTAEKRYFCEYSGCFRSYTTAGNLKTHIKVHTGEFSFICDENTCHKVFLTSYQLRIHRRVHTKEKPYECNSNECTKRFNTLYRLKAHLRIHNGDLFKCEACVKKFTSKSDLRKHFRIHSGEKPFKCTVDDCTKAFTASHHLRSHFNTHQNKRFKCSEKLCDKKFKSDTSLNNHLRTEHKFKILKNKNATNQNETIRIEAHSTWIPAAAASTPLVSNQTQPNTDPQQTSQQYISDLNTETFNSIENSSSSLPSLDDPFLFATNFTTAANNNQLPEINHLADNALFRTVEKEYEQTMSQENLTLSNNNTNIANNQPSFYFDSSSGVLTVNSNSPVSTNSLNTQSLYNLLIRLQENDQLKLNNDSLTSQFYISSEELNSLLEPNQIADFTRQEVNNYQPENFNFNLIESADPPTHVTTLDTNTNGTDMLQPAEASLQPREANYQCQELCCLLKFNPLDGDLL